VSRLRLLPRGHRRPLLLGLLLALGQVQPLAHSDQPPPATSVTAATPETPAEAATTPGDPAPIALPSAELLAPAPVELTPLSPADAPPATPAPANPAPAPSALPAPALPAWQAHAVPVAWPGDGRPAVVIIIDDLGLDTRRTARVIRLPGPLTLSWLPYAPNLKARTAEAHGAGHELLVHLPMEPLRASADPGPNALKVELAPAENLRRLALGLAAFDGYVGINNHMGSRFTSERAAVTPILEELQRRGLLFVDSRTAAGSVAAPVADSLDLPSTSRDVFLDNQLSRAAVRQELQRLEAIARRTGVAIAIGHPHDQTLAELEPWLKGLRARGFDLVPVSAVVAQRHERIHGQIAAHRGSPN